MNKFCRGCNTTKNVSEFSKNASNSDGLYTYCSSCKSKRYAEWRAKNIESEKARQREWKSQNRDSLNDYQRRWSAENPAKAKEIRRRKEYKRKSGGTLPLGAYELLVGLFGERCLSCNSTDDITIDHVVPIIIGGKSDIDNLQLLCRSCNSRKGRSIIDYRHNGNSK